MAEDVDFVFHANRLLENPAWRKALDDVRRKLHSERDSLDYAAEERLYISIAETLLTKIERRIETMATANKVKQFHLEQAKRIP